MKISVNLATRPFVELRPLYAKLRLGMVALALIAIGVGLVLHVETARAKVAKAQMDALKAQTAGYQNQLIANEARMRQPQNKAVLDRAQFLNRTFAQKSFSWTAVMMDLENVLPTGVQVTSIEPLISKEGDVSIRLRVSGDRSRAVELVRNLERSQRFLRPALTSESMETSQSKAGPGQAEAAPGGVEFDILSGYNPLPVFPAHPHRSESKTENASSDATAETTSSAPPRRKHSRGHAVPAAPVTGGAR
ncbi:MAG TPA: PilN domain-containing protein [Granulicella sp.]|nr:PilN domain-containing protein [Granulicella sp.]